MQDWSERREVRPLERRKALKSRRQGNPQRREIAARNDGWLRQARSVRAWGLALLIQQGWSSYALTQTSPTSM